MLFCPILVHHPVEEKASARLLMEATPRFVVWCVRPERSTSMHRHCFECDLAASLSPPPASSCRPGSRCRRLLCGSRREHIEKCYVEHFLAEKNNSRVRARARFAFMTLGGLSSTIIRTELNRYCKLLAFLSLDGFLLEPSPLKGLDSL